MVTSMYSFFFLTNLFFHQLLFWHFFFKSQQINYYQRNLMIRVKNRENQNKFTFRFGFFWRWPCVHQLEDIQAQKISKNFCFLTTTSAVSSSAKVQAMCQKTKIRRNENTLRRERGCMSYPSRDYP